MLPIGLHEGIAHDVYHADPSERPSLSSHCAVTLIRRSPAHAHLNHPRFGGVVGESTAEQDAGSIIHDMLLGGGQEVVRIDAPDFKTKKAQQERDAARDAGKIPIIAHKYEALRATVKEMRAVLPVDFSKARCELTAIWESNGCPCRCRIDSLFSPDGPWLLGGKVASLANGLWKIYDVKTCENAMLASEARNLFSMGYHVQAAANLDAIETLIPESAGRVSFVDLFIEREPPFGVVEVEFAGDFRELGARQWNRAKALWAACLASNKWPGYESKKTVSAPAWALGEEMSAAIVAAGPPPF